MKKIIDFTHKLENGLPVYPGTPPPSFKKAASIEQNGWAEIRMDVSTHMGTHMDAPAHIIPGGKSLDQLPLEQFMGKAFILDCSRVSIITKDMLDQNIEKIRQSDFILFATNWDERWGKKSYFDQPPTLSRDAAEFLVKKNIKGVGFDHISADTHEDSSLPIHNILLSNNVLIIENLTGLTKALDKIIDFYCIPLRISDSDGSPVRAFGIEL